MGILTALLALPVYAHQASNHYIGTWPNGTPYTIDWYFDDDFWTGNWRDRVKDADDEWKSLLPSRLDWSASGEVNNTHNTGICNWDIMKEGMIWEWWWNDSTILADTEMCGTGSTMENFGMRINDNSAINWYRGTDIPSHSETDLWSIATHEFGHSSGWGPGNKHFTETGNPAICDKTQNDYHTMCDRYYHTTSEYPARGRWWRTIEYHDIDTYEDAY